MNTLKGGANMLTATNNPMAAGRMSIAPRDGAHSAIRKLPGRNQRMSGAVTSSSTGHRGAHRVGRDIGLGLVAAWEALIPFHALADTAAAAPRPAAGLSDYGALLTPLLLYGVYRVMADTFASKQTASASHILVADVAIAQSLKEKLDEAPSDGIPEMFSALAKENSTCPSAASGGSLGTFRPGQMVPQFDRVVFNPDRALGAVHGPVSTSFGHHLILVTERTDKEGNSEQ